MKKIVKKTIIFEFEEIYKAMLSKRGTIENTTGFKYHIRKDGSNFVLTGTKLLSTEAINKVVLSELKKAGEEGKFEISVEGQRFVCREKNKETKIVNEEEASEFLKKTLEELFNEDWYSGVGYLATRACNCLAPFFKTSATVEEVINLDREKNSLPRNFGRKTWLSIIEYFQSHGIATDLYPIAKWF